jgi:hypothetical protein
MKIVWDEPKRLANLDKHGLNFADLDETFFDSALVLPSRQDWHWQKHAWRNRVVFVALGKETVSVVSMRPCQQERKEALCRILKRRGLQGIEWVILGDHSGGTACGY